MARKILLADDSVTAQNMGRRILSDAGYEVITVNNGSAALKKIAEIVPDLIVLDVYMPGYGGLEVCQRLKESQATARIPVLLTVGKLEPFKVDEARRVRADAHIVKPFDSTELLAAIIKLEDKIVPQAAAGKQGRSTKAGSSTETPRRGRDKSADPGSETTSGWRKRLSIPRSAPVPEPVESEPKPASTAFHDLGRGDDQEAAKPELPEPATEVVLPQEAALTVEKTESVIPFDRFMVERLMAIEASVPSAEAPTSLSEVETKPELTATDVPAGEVNLPEEVKVEPATAEAPELEAVSFEPAPATKSESAKSERSPTEDEVTAALASLSPVSEETKFNPAAENAPVTALSAALAAVGAVCGGPRWIAEPVPLSDGDSHLILESEMEKTYAAFAAAESARTVAVAEASGEANAIESAPVVSSVQSSSVESFAEPQSAPDLPNQELNVSPEAGEAAASENDAVSANSDVPFQAAPEALPDSVAHELVNPNGVSEPVQVKAESAETAAPAEITSIGYREIAYAAAASGGSSSAVETRRDVSSFAVEPPVSSGQVTESLGVEPASVVPTDIAAPAESPEGVETASELVPLAVPASDSGNQERESQLAAAWQNWRQIRESIVGPQLTSQIAEAASAGFKQIRGEEKPPSDQQETEAAASNRAAAEASTIAGIVDSVFAELKPKLMEEIAKKLAADRK